MVAFIERKPGAMAAHRGPARPLGRNGRLRYLNQALLDRLQIWDKPDARCGPSLAALPTRAAHAVRDVGLQRRVRERRRAPVLLQFLRLVAPEVHAALIELGLDRQAAIFKRALDMFGANYPRDMGKRRDKYFSHEGLERVDKALSDLTDDFYALDGGPTVVRLGGNTAIEGGPGSGPPWASTPAARSCCPADQRGAPPYG